LLAGFLERWVDRLPALLLLLVAGTTLSPGLLARPHLLALPPLVLWTAGLILARRRERLPALWLLPLMTLWANLHGSFVLGLALTGPFALEAVVAAPAGGRAAAVRGWGVFFVGAVIASMLTPQGWAGLLFPFHVMTMRYNVHLLEWLPADFSALRPLEIVLMAGLFVALTGRVTVPVLRVLVLLGLLHVALQHQRQQMILGLVGALIFADALSSDVTRGRITAGRTASGAAIGGAVVLALLLTVGRAADPIERRDSQTSPISAVAHVPTDLARTPVFNDYGFGGYLIFKGIRPFVDGRADLYGDEFLARNLAAEESPDAFRAIAAAYGIRWALLRTGSPAAGFLATLAGWRLLYSDPVAVVYVRADEDAG